MTTPTQEEELKPCPFCNARVGIREDYSSVYKENMYEIYCTCGGSFNANHFNNKENIIKAWNIRHNEQEIERVKRDLIKTIKAELFLVAKTEFNQKPGWKEPTESSPYVTWGAVEYVLGKFDYEQSKQAEGVE